MRSPLGGLPARLADRPLAQRADQAGLLGERDELVGADRAALGVGPARERLGADRAARGQLDDGLVVQLEPAVRDRLPEPGRELEPLLGIARVGLVEAAGVAARRLGVVHGGVGVLQEGLRVGGVEREQAHADARADEQLGRPGRHRLDEHGPHPPRRLLGGARGALDRSRGDRGAGRGTRRRRRARRGRTPWSRRAGGPATATSTSSPTSWPKPSFTILKSSRSTYIAPTARPCLRARAIASSSAVRNWSRFGSPVSGSWFARCESSCSARFWSVMSKIIPWVSVRWPSTAGRITVRSTTQRTSPSGGDDAVLGVERLAALVRLHERPPRHARGPPDGRSAARRPGWPSTRPG